MSNSSYIETLQLAYKDSILVMRRDVSFGIDNIQGTMRCFYQTNCHSLYSPFLVFRMEVGGGSFYRFHRSFHRFHSSHGSGRKLPRKLRNNPRKYSEAFVEASTASIDASTGSFGVLPRHKLPRKLGGASTEAHHHFHENYIACVSMETGGSFH